MNINAPKNNFVIVVFIVRCFKYCFFVFVYGTKMQTLLPSGFKIA
jgi:hypothetical protein